MIKRACLLILLTTLCLLKVSAQRQRFFNLTSQEVKIDSVLPVFTHVFALGDNYADSTYTVSILYPEYVDMSKSEIEAYKSITSDTLPTSPDIEQRIVVERKRGSLEVCFTPLVIQNGRPRILVSFMLDVKARAKSKTLRRAAAARRASAADRYAAHSILAEGRWVKIRVPETGVYQLTSSLISSAGFSNPSKVKIYGYGGLLQNEKLVPEELIATDDLKEVPTCEVNGRRLFFAKGTVTWKDMESTERIRNPYSDYGYYFLTESDDEPLTVDSAEFVSSFYPSVDDNHFLHEKDEIEWYIGGRNLFEERSIAEGESVGYPIVVANGTNNGMVRVVVTARINNSAVGISYKNELMGKLAFTVGPHEYAASKTFEFRCEDMHTGDTITVENLSGGPARLDYISIAYDTPIPAPNLSKDNFPVPEYVYGITNQDLHGDGQYDMIIIVPATQKLTSQANRLKQFHEEHDGMRVRVVPADELYNEFSSGTPDINAYRRYLKMMYDRAETEADMPKYVIFFGDGSWDNRMRTSLWKGVSPDDYLLCYGSENSFSTTECYVDDGFICLLDDGEGADPLTRDKLDMSVGRFPVVEEHEAKVMVDKVISYVTNKNASTWENTIMFMGDDGNGNLHMRDCDAAAEDITFRYPGYIIKKVMWDAYKRENTSTGTSYPEVETIVKQQQANGALIMDYCGHAAETTISHEKVLSITDFRAFKNTNLPLWVTACCDIMPFDSRLETIGETAVTSEKGGAIAFFGTTRTVYANYNKYINMSYLKHVLSTVNGKPTTIGEAQRLAKNEMITSGRDRTCNKLQYSLLGDPAIALNMPTLTAVIDEINGIQTATLPSDELIQLKSGQTVKIKGRIVNDGGTDTSYNGRVTATVRDAKEIITCRMNDTSDKDMTEPFTFYDYQKQVYNGTDSVRAGQFELVFAVPKDISYSNNNAIVNLWAVDNNGVIANGCYKEFCLNGSVDVVNDSIGPSIYCYLNSPSFVDGGNVNTTPFFVAEVTDKDGINASGSGIGHDLELIIDGDMNRTYILNDNFSYDFGTYTSGTTFYTIPELSVGAHQLKFRAWDILNNSSSATLHFNVVTGLAPELFSVSCTSNPATTSTTFILNHNRQGSDVDVMIEVFDLSGRILWKHSETGVSTTSAYTVDWDLTVDGGQRLQTGVYLYRASVSTDGSPRASKAKKLIIISNK